MPRLRGGERQENIGLPEELVRQVEGYRFDKRLPNKKDAYRELLEKGLAEVQRGTTDK